MSERFLGLTSTKHSIKCLAHGHYTNYELIPKLSLAQMDMSTLAFILHIWDKYRNLMRILHECFYFIEFIKQVQEKQ